MKAISKESYIVLTHALADYERLKAKINENESFEQIYNGLNNSVDVNVFNKETDLFDFDYRSISGTIYAKDNGNAFVGKDFDVWNDETCELILENANEKKIAEMLGDDSNLKQKKNVVKNKPKSR